MFGNIAFASPYILGFFVMLPLLWWLLRLTPPSPQKVVFPALALLRDLAAPEQTPARTPWWLLVLRLVISALLICALARPVVDPLPTIGGQGVMLIAIDNDWAAARDWETRQKTLHDLIHQAERENRSVLLLPTTPPASGDTLQIIGPLAAKAATTEIERIVPEPWASDWTQATSIVQKLDRTTIGDAFWLSSGLGGVDAKIFYNALNDNGGVKVLADAETPIYLLSPPQSENDDLILAVRRANTDNDAVLVLSALAQDEHVLAHLPIHFMPGTPRATTPLNLPLDVRNLIARFEIEGQRSAATTALLDAGWEHRPVGIVGDAGELAQHSLLSGMFYIDRALKPYADIHVDQLDALLKQNMAVLILSDATELNDDQIVQLIAWVKKGGVLVRFAGEKMAATQNPKESNLLPVTLRTGDRSLGGALSWATPQKLKDFPSSSPFRGLPLPDDVTINRQILAEPSPDLATRSWATLADGTPLVTSKNIGSGLSILFHVPARSDWSNLPLSGLFVDMLRRIVDLSHGAGSEMNFAALAPLHLLDAFGEEQKITAATQAITDNDFSKIEAGPQHPPGLYGTDSFNRAFNLGGSLGQPDALNGIAAEGYKQNTQEIELQPFLLVTAFVLMLIDFLISLALRGVLAWPRRKIAAAICFLALMLSYQAAKAATDAENPVDLTSKTVLAYVKTDDRQTDHISEAGLKTLARALQQRTSMNQIAVAAVDPNNDELAFFPILYWPIVAGEAPLSAPGVQHVNDYLHHGGMILLDSMTGDVPSQVLLHSVLANVDIPPLAPMPQDHVLKRSFYLLDAFPGRYAPADFWLEPEDMSSYDGVATVLLGSSGWAAAWAADDAGHFMFPCTPGGELQREHAFRFGVNVVMYALTGNYKSDQLHAQALLQKLGK